MTPILREFRKSQSSAQATRIGIIECEDRKEAEQIIDDLDEIATQNSASESYVTLNRSVISQLAEKVTVISPPSITSNTRWKGLRWVTPSSAKGREFDGCVIYHLFEGEGAPSNEEYRNWYTAITRARDTLLVVATTDELERAGRNFFQNCRRATRNDISELYSELAGFAGDETRQEEFEQLILEAAQNGYVYWDLFEGFNALEIEERRRLESKIVAQLQLHGEERLQEEIREIEREQPQYQTALKLLLGLSLRQIRSHIRELFQDSSDNQNEIRWIADLIESNGYPYEAARLRYHLGYDLPDLPLQDFVKSHPDNLSLAFCKAAISAFSEA